MLFANNKRLYSISLGPKRSTFLNEIKKIDPKWYNENGKFLNVEVHSDMNKVRIEITKYFKPYIEKLFKINYQRIKDKNYSLTKDKIYDEIAKSVK